MLQNCSIDKIADVFFNEPDKKHYLKEISKKANLAHTSVKEHLKKLMRQSIIKEEIEIKGRRKFPLYYADIENTNYKNSKKLNNLTKIMNSGLIEFLKDNTMPESIVLFGSYQRGEDTEKSDIDIFIHSSKIELDLKKFEKKLNRKIQLHFKKDFKEYPAELKNNIINGITIYGFLEGY